MGWDIYVEAFVTCELSIFLKYYEKKLKNQIDDEKILNLLLLRYSKLDRDIFFKDMTIIIESPGDWFIDNCSELLFDETLPETLQIINPYLTYISVLYLIEELNNNNIQKYIKILEDDEYVYFKDNKINISIDSWISYKGRNDLNIDYREIANIIDEWKCIIPEIVVKTQSSISN